jgi:hypothetical protein
MKLHEKAFRTFKKLIYLDNMKKEEQKACTIPDREIKPDELRWDVTFKNNIKK